MHIHTSNRRFRIDLVPTFHLGLWQVRQDISYDGEKWEEIGVLEFGTEKEADAFIDRWIAKQRAKNDSVSKS